MTDPLYTSFHDEEWGVPVFDDRKLFELLVFSQALAELSWHAILNKRDIFRYGCLSFSLIYFFLEEERRACLTCFFYSFCQETF